MSIDYLSDLRFSDLPLLPEIKSSLAKADFEFCTPVQAKSLEYSLNGRDVTGQAQTGTGKTAAFLIAVFQTLLQDKGRQQKPGDVSCLIVVPTRELAIQIAKDATMLSGNTDLNIASVYGGTGYSKQASQFQKPVDILIGTPGRLIDYWKQKLFNLRSVKVLVLDEADRMFDLGFISDIRFLMRRCPNPQKRLNMLFSATLSQKVLELSYEHMNNPAKVVIKSDVVPASSIQQSVYYPANNEKLSLLVGLLKRDEPFRSIIFVNTKRNAEAIDACLRGNDLRAEMMSGDVRQNKRERILQQFEKGDIDILIATDVAARGLHINDVSHIYNYDLPQLAEDYVHRIGRTARAGASGVAISFACEDTAFYLPDIEEYTQQALPVEGISSELLVKLSPSKRIHRPKKPGFKSNQNKSGRSHHSKSGGNRKDDDKKSNNKRRFHRKPRKKPDSAKKDES